MSNSFAGLWLCVTIFLLTLAGPAPFAQAQGEPVLTIAFCAETWGYYDPCPT